MTPTRRGAPRGKTKGDSHGDRRDGHPRPRQPRQRTPRTHRPPGGPRTIATPIPTLAEAQADLDLLDAQQAEWQGKRATLLATLAERERGAAEAALVGTATGKLSAELARLRDELGIADQALALLAVRRDETRYRVRLADFHDRRARHEALFAEAEALWAQVEAAWEPLAELTGATLDEVRGALARTPRLWGLVDQSERLRSDINYRADNLRDEGRSYV